MSATNVIDFSTIRREHRPHWRDWVLREEGFCGLDFCDLDREHYQALIDAGVVRCPGEGSYGMRMLRRVFKFKHRKEIWCAVYYDNRNGRWLLQPRFRVEGTELEVREQLEKKQIFIIPELWDMLRETTSTAPVT